MTLKKIKLDKRTKEYKKIEAETVSEIHQAIKDELLPVTPYTVKIVAEIMIHHMVFADEAAKIAKEKILKELDRFAKEQILKELDRLKELLPKESKKTGWGF